MAARQLADVAKQIENDLAAREEAEGFLGPCRAAIQLARAARAAPRAEMLDSGGNGRLGSRRDLRKILRDTGLHLGELAHRAHVLEMFFRRAIRLESAFFVGVLAGVRTTKPVAVRDPQLAPFVGRLDVVVIGEALGFLPATGPESPGRTGSAGNGGASRVERPQAREDGLLADAPGSATLPAPGGRPFGALPLRHLSAAPPRRPPCWPSDSSTSRRGCSASRSPSTSEPPARRRR